MIRYSEEKNISMNYDQTEENDQMNCQKKQENEYCQILETKVKPRSPTEHNALISM